MLEFKINQDDSTRSVVLEQREVVIGRTNDRQSIDLDLTPDNTVSRVHARVWLENGIIRIDDLGSSLGTTVNGRPVQGARILRSPDKVQMGDTVMSVKLASRKAREAAKVAASQPAGRSGTGDAVSADGPLSMIEIEFEGQVRGVPFSKEEMIIGRSHQEHTVDVDLNPDLSVSRTHARLLRERAFIWVEDLGSTHGTTVNGKPLTTKRRMLGTDQVEIGDSVIRIRRPTRKAASKSAAAPAEPVSEPEKGSELKPPPRVPRKNAPKAPRRPVSKSVSKAAPSKKRAPRKMPSVMEVFRRVEHPYVPPEGRNMPAILEACEGEEEPLGQIQVVASHSVDGELKLDTINTQRSYDYVHALIALPGALGKIEDSNGLVKEAVGRFIDALPDAARGWCLLADGEEGKFSLAAHMPVLKPGISPLLANRVLVDRKGFLWEPESGKVTATSGMMVPLVCGEEEIGVLGVEGGKDAKVYKEGDLCFLLAFAQVMGVSLRNQQLTELLS